MSEVLENYWGGAWHSDEGVSIALADCAATLKKNRERYLKISLKNSGTTDADSSIDVDGAVP